MEVEDKKIVPGTKENWVERIAYRVDIRLHDIPRF